MGDKYMRKMFNLTIKKNYKWYMFKSNLIYVKAEDDIFLPKEAVYIRSLYHLRKYRSIWLDYYVETKDETYIKLIFANDEKLVKRYMNNPIDIYEYLDKVYNKECKRILALADSLV